MTVVPAYEMEARRLARRHDVSVEGAITLASVMDRVRGAIEAGQLTARDKQDLAWSLRGEIINNVYDALDEVGIQPPVGFVTTLIESVRAELSGIIPDEILKLAVNPDRQ